MTSVNKNDIRKYLKNCDNLHVDYRYILKICKTVGLSVERFEGKVISGKP